MEVDSQGCLRMTSFESGGCLVPSKRSELHLRLRFVAGPVRAQRMYYHPSKENHSEEFGITCKWLDWTARHLVSGFRWKGW